MDGGIENLASPWEVLKTNVTNDEVPVSTEVTETNEVKDESLLTLEETLYDKVIEEDKDEKKAELEAEISKYKIPDIEEVETEVKQWESNEIEINPIEEEIDQKAMEDEVKDVVEEIDNEKDTKIKRKQWEDLLISLREDIVSQKRQIRENEIEIQALIKRQEELIEENSDLKYSWRIKLDDELEHLHYLKDKISKKPDDKETQKQLALYHAKALNGIYPEFDIQDSFTQINERRKAGIRALSWGSEGYTEDKQVKTFKTNFAAHWVKVK